MKLTKKNNSKTVFQSFADWLAISANDKTEEYIVTSSESTFVAMRKRDVE